MSGHTVESCIVADGPVTERQSSQSHCNGSSGSWIFALSPTPGDIVDSPAGECGLGDILDGRQCSITSPWAGYCHLLVLTTVAQGD